MTVQPNDLRDILHKIRYDTTAIQAKITDALRYLDELNLTPRPETTCPHCGPIPGGAHALAEHLHISHDGPAPDHWKHLETLISSEDAA